MTAEDTVFEPLSLDQLNKLRLRIVQGEEPTLEEMQRVVQTFQMQRTSVAEKAPKEKKTKTPPPNLDDLLV